MGGSGLIGARFAGISINAGTEKGSVTDLDLSLKHTAEILDPALTKRVVADQRAGQERLGNHEPLTPKCGDPSTKSLLARMNYTHSQ